MINLFLFHFWTFSILLLLAVKCDVQFNAHSHAVYKQQLKMFSTGLCIFVFVRAAGSNFQMASSPISFFQWLHLETVLCYIALCIYALDAMLLTLALIAPAVT